MTTTNHTSPSGEDAANGAMGEREAFEAFWTREMNVLTMDLHRCEFPMTPDHEQPYACHETQRSWLTWQARAASTQSTATQPVQADTEVTCTHPVVCPHAFLDDDGRWNCAQCMAAAQPASGGEA